MATQPSQAPFSSYEQELERLREREAFAKALQLQSMAPPEAPQSQGRIAARVHPLQLASGLLRNTSALAEREQTGRERKDLTDRYQREMIEALQSGDPMKMIAHPALRDLGMRQMLAQQFARSLRGGSAAGAPGQSAPGMSEGTSRAFEGALGVEPTGQYATPPEAPPQQQGGGDLEPFGLPYGAFASAGMAPGGDRYMDALMKARETINAPPGSTIMRYNQPPVTVPENGIQTQYRNGQPYASAVPGYADIQTRRAAEQAAARSGGEKYGAAPFSLETVQHPGGGATQQTLQQRIEAATGRPMPMPYGMGAPQMPPQGAPGAAGAPQAPGMGQPPMPVDQGMPRASVDVTGMSPEAGMMSYLQAAQRAGIQYPQGAPGQAPRPAPVGAPVASETQQSAAKAIDTKFAPDFVEFTTGLGEDGMRQIANLRQALNMLTSKDPNRPNLTGPMVGMMPDFAKAIWWKDAKNVQRMVEEIVQRGMRAILGAQFTEKEGERLIARTYDPSLDEAMNAQTLGRLLIQMDLGMKQKLSAVEHFRQHGTLQGWRGQLPNIGEYYKAVGGADGAGAAGATRLSPETIEFMRKNNIPLPPGY